MTRPSRVRQGGLDRTVRCVGPLHRTVKRVQGDDPTGPPKAASADEDVPPRTRGDEIPASTEACQTSAPGAPVQRVYDSILAVAIRFGPRTAGEAATDPRVGKNHRSVPVNRVEREDPVRRIEGNLTRRVVTRLRDGAILRWRRPGTTRRVKISSMADGILSLDAVRKRSGGSSRPSGPSRLHRRPRSEPNCNGQGWNRIHVEPEHRSARLASPVDAGIFISRGPRRHRLRGGGAFGGPGRVVALNFLTVL